MSIKNKLLLLVGICFLAMTVVAGGLVYIQQEKWIQKEAEAHAKEAGKDIAGSYSGSTAQTGHEFEKETLKALATRKEIKAARLFRSPLVTIDFPEMKDPSLKPKDNFETQVFSGNRSFTQAVSEGGVKYAEAAIPILMEKDNGCENCHTAQPGQVLGGARVTARVDQFGAGIKSDRQDMLLIAGALLVFLMAFIMSLLTRLVDKPITAVIRAAERIAAGEISEVKLKADSKDEVGRLADVFSRMTKSLSEIASGAKVMAGGDLSRRINQSGELAESFNGMVDSLNNLVNKIHSGSAMLGEALHSISQTAAEQSQNAEEQIKKVESLENTITEFSGDASSAAEKSDRMLVIAKNTLKSTKIGKMAARESQKAMMSIRERMDETTARVMELREKTNHISRILEMINDVAMETKILSVNASIEASKAGEAGKGFSVVAEEIAKLAENVVQATSSIKDANDEIQSFYGALTGAIESSGKSVREGVETIRKVDGSLEEMVEAATKTAAAAQKISNISRGQNDKSRAVLSTMHTITASMKEFTLAAQKTNREVEGIKGLFNNLRKDVAVFKTGSGDGAGGKSSASRAAAPEPHKAELSKTETGSGPA